jgi:O-antigen/teichoic acid export membrane protein
MIFTIIVTPLWAAFTESYVKGDLLWIEKTSKTIRKMFLVSLLFILLFVLIADFFYKIWIGIEFRIPFSLTLSMAIYVVVYNLLSSYIYLINGVGKILVQMLISIFSIIVYIPLALLFSDWFGVSGPINATTVLLIPLTISAYIQYKKIISSNLTGIWNR